MGPGAVGGWLGAVPASSINLGSPSRIGKELIPGVPLATPDRLAPDDMPVLAANRAPPSLQINAVRAGTRLWEPRGCKSTAATRTSSAFGKSVWWSTTCCGCRLCRRLGRQSAMSHRGHALVVLVSAGRHRTPALGTTVHLPAWHEATRVISWGSWLSSTSYPLHPVHKLG